MNKRELFWGNPEKQTFPALKKSIEADYLIVGGGITGLATAYFLTTHRKKRVVIIEKNTVGSGSTGHSAGMLVHEPEHANWYELITAYGTKATKAYFEAHIQATKLVKRIIVQNNIPCDFVEHDYLHLSDEEERSSSGFYMNYRTVQKTLDSQLELLTDTALKSEFASTLYTAVRRSRRHNISVNPLAFARGFGKYLEAKGVQIYEHTALLKKLSPTTVQTDGGIITYKHIIYCRGTSEPHNAITPFLTTIGVTRKLTKKELGMIGLLDKDMFENSTTRPSFHYGKVTSDNRLLVGYGDKPVSKKNFSYPAYLPHVKKIEQFLTANFPTLDLPLQSAWSAPYALTTKGLPIVELHNEQELTINGAGLQIGCIATASYGVHTLLQKPHPLELLFNKK